MRLLLGLAIAAALLIGISIVFFYQYKDPMILVFGVVLSLMLAGVVGVVHLLRRGIPVRVVDEKR